MKKNAISCTLIFLKIRTLLYWINFEIQFSMARARLGQSPLGRVPHATRSPLDVQARSKVFNKTK
jgi:hypothetical protein